MPSFAVWLFVPAGLMLLVLLWLLIGSRGSQSREDRWRESSRVWATPRDLERLIVDQDTPGRLRLGWITKNKFVKTANLRSLLVMAPSGSGKTPRVVVPNVLKHAGPAVVASVKGDVLHLTLANRQRKGKVWVFDPTNATGIQSARWTPLMGIHTYADALRNAAWLCDSSKSGEKGLEGQQYWDSQGKRCIAPCLLLAARTGQPMTEIGHWIKRNLDDVVAVGIERLGRDGADALADWNSYASLDHRAKSSVAGTANVILDAWTHPDVRASTTNDPNSPLAPLDLDELLRGDNTLYLVAPASEQAMFTPIFETVVNSVLRRVEEYAQRSGGTPLNPSLLLALDEAANIAPLRKLDQVASKAAGEGVQLMSIWQDYSQIIKIYGDAGARTVLSNHWAELYLPGITDEQTLRHISEAIGKDLLNRTSWSYDAAGRKSQSTSTYDIDVAPQSWLRKRPANEAIVLSGNYPPMRLILPGWFEDKSLRKLIDPTVAARFDAAFAGTTPRLVTPPPPRRLSLIEQDPVDRDTRYATAIPAPVTTAPVVSALDVRPIPAGGKYNTGAATLHATPVVPAPRMAPSPTPVAPARVAETTAPHTGFVPLPPRHGGNAAGGGKYETGLHHLTTPATPAAPAAAAQVPATPVPVTPAPSQPAPQMQWTPVQEPAPRPPSVPEPPRDYSREYRPAPAASAVDPAADVAEAACRLAIAKGVVSAGILHRELGIDGDTAERTLAVLERQGIIGPANGPFPRPALVKPDELGHAIRRVRSATTGMGLHR